MSVPVLLYTIFNFIRSNGWTNSDYGVKAENPNNPELGQLFFFQFEKQNPVFGDEIAIITIELNNRNCHIYIKGWLGIYTGQMLVQNPEQIFRYLQWGINATCPIIIPSD